MSIGGAIKAAGAAFRTGLRGNVAGVNPAAATPVSAPMAQPTAHDVPRSWTTNYLGPGTPVQPLETGLRAEERENEPRTFQYNPNVNATISPRLAYGLTSFADLKYYAENVPEVAKCMRILIEEIKAFVPRLVDDNGEEVGDPSLQWMITRPDGVSPWPVFVSRWLSNVLYYDAGCLFRVKDMSGKLRALRPIDGSIIFLVIDQYGNQPQPPAPAFQQMIYGMPRSQWTTDQLWYMPRHVRPDAPYGKSPIEDSLRSVKLLDNYWTYAAAQYTEGNMPAMLLEAPPNMSAPDALTWEREFNDRMAGNAAERVKIRVVPNGFKPVTQRPVFAEMPDYERALETVCLNFGIPPSELGKTPGMGLGGRGFKEAMESALYRMGLAPLMSYITGAYDTFLTEMKLSSVHLELAFPGQSIDPEKENDRVVKLFTGSVINRNEARGQLGFDPVKGEAGDAFLLPTGKGGQPLDSSAEPVEPEPTVSKLRKAVQTLLRKAGVAKDADHVPGQLCPYDDCCHDLAIPSSGWYACGSCGRTFYAEETESDFEDYACYTGETASARGIPGTVPPYVVARDLGASYGTPDAKVASAERVEAVVIPLMLKHCGVCLEDDAYYGAPVTRSVKAPMDGHHVNDVEVVALSPMGRESVAALWKPEGGEDDVQIELVGGPLFVREEAVYLIDRALRFWLVPVAYIAEVDGEMGAAIYYANANPPREPEEYDPAWIERAAVLDYIIGQHDRNSHNWLTHPDDANRPILYDNGLTLATGMITIRSGFIKAWGSRMLSADVMDSVRILAGDLPLWKDLQELIGGEAVQRARQRVSNVVQLGKVPTDTIPDYEPPAMIERPAVVADGHHHGDVYDDDNHTSGETNYAPGSGAYDVRPGANAVAGSTAVTYADAAWSLRKGADGHTGVMIALALPEVAATCLTADPLSFPVGSEVLPASEMHITLVFLGDSKDMTVAQLGSIQKVLDAYCFAHEPLTGKVGGIGRFIGAEADKDALYASFDCPGLAAFRTDLVRALASQGISPASEHDFTPHITLAYIPTGSPMPAVTPPPVEITFDCVTLFVAESRTAYPLTVSSSSDN